MEYCGISDREQLKGDHRHWVEEALTREEGRRDACRAESIAVGNRVFIEATREDLGIRAVGRRMEEKNEQCVL